MDSYFRLVERLEQAVPETDPRFESQLGEVAASEKLLRLVAGDRDLPDDVAFAGFCRLLTVLRRNGNLASFRQTLADHEPRFGHRPMFSHHLAIWLGFGNRRDDLRRALGLSRQNLAMLGDSPGVTHVFAETVAKVGELYPGDVTDTDITVGLDAVQTAIDVLPGYGKYYATRARLRCLAGDTEGAYEDVAKAIRLEPEHPTTAYVLRIVRYEQILLRASLQRH